MTVLNRPRPEVYIDADGCCMDLDARLAELYQAVRGTPMSPVDIRTTASWSDIDDLLVLPGVFRNVPPIVGSHWGIEQLRKIVRLLVATSCSRNPDSATDKLVSLRDIHGFSIRDVIPIKEKWRLRGDGLIEDTLENAAYFADANPNALVGLFVYPGTLELLQMEYVGPDPYTWRAPSLARNIVVVPVFIDDVTSDGRWDLTRPWQRMVTYFRERFETLDFK